MRIAVGQLWQETNTFNPNPTRWDDFGTMGIAFGNDVVDLYGKTGELSGFLGQWENSDAGDAQQESVTTPEFVGLARFACWPSGSVDAETWHRIRDTFQSRLDKAGEVDAVYLCLHGAMCSEDEPDLSGRLLADVRKIVGPDVPIAGSLDLHANFTSLMQESANVLAGYHTAPHIDSVETGARAAAALKTLLANPMSKAVTEVRRLPMITAAENHNTLNGIPHDLYETLKNWEQEPNILSAGLYMAMPWFDCPELGWCVTRTCLDEPPQDGKLDEFAERTWNLRHQMEAADRIAPDDVVQQALQVEGKPVVIGDGADATNSGSTGDVTTLLREFLRQPIPGGGALTFMVDPEAVKQAQQVGEGGRFDFPVGGKLCSYSEPVPITGVVERLTDVRWILTGHISTNLPIDMGAGAIVRSGDVTILLCERSGPGSSPQLYQSQGLDPRDFKIVVAKSPSGFRADYASFAAAMMSADCPGCASPDWNRMPFRNIPRPLFPFDDIADWRGDF